MCHSFSHLRNIWPVWFLMNVSWSECGYKVTRTFCLYQFSPWGDGAVWSAGCVMRKGSDIERCWTLPSCSLSQSSSLRLLNLGDTLGCRYFLIAWSFVVTGWAEDLLVLSQKASLSDQVLGFIFSIWNQIIKALCCQNLVSIIRF